MRALWYDLTNGHASGLRPRPGLSDAVRIARTCCCRLVRTPDAVWLDLSGVSALRIAMPIDSAVETDAVEPNGR